MAVLLRETRDDNANEKTGQTRQSQTRDAVQWVAMRQPRPGSANIVVHLHGHSAHEGCDPPGSVCSREIACSTTIRGPGARIVGRALTRTCPMACEQCVSWYDSVRKLLARDNQISTPRQCDCPLVRRGPQSDAPTTHPGIIVIQKYTDTSRHPYSITLAETASDTD